MKRLSESMRVTVHSAGSTVPTSKHAWRGGKLGEVPRRFEVVTHKRWIAELFGPLGARQNMGFDIDPETALDTIWWAPGAWVASAHRAGIQLPLLSCGPDWLTNVPMEYRGRRVQNKTIDEIFPGKTRPTFAKLPEVKHDGVPAQVYGECYLRDTLKQYNLPAETVWQLQEPVEFIHEARYWIAHREIVAASMYKINNVIWGDPRWDEVQFDCLSSQEAMDILARKVVRDVGQPPGWVLDIGMTEDGPLVIEANAAWSSGPYDGDPEGIFRAIVASHDFDQRFPQWAWRHSPVFDKVRPLKLSQPVIS